MNDYLEERVKAQRAWYEKKATENKNKFISYQTIIIILGATIPVVVAFKSVIPALAQYVETITVIISALISIYAGLDKLNQPQPNWFNYRANEEAIKKEEWFHKYKAGPYRNIDDEERKTMFVERIESIISSDIARTTNINTKSNVTDNGNSIPEQPPK